MAAEYLESILDVCVSDLSGTRGGKTHKRHKPHLGDAFLVHKTCMQLVTQLAIHLNAEEKLRRMEPPDHTVALQSSRICSLELEVVRKTASQKDLEQTINRGVLRILSQLFHGWHIQKVALWVT